MKTQTLKNKVIERMIKNGNNENEVYEMVNSLFDEAVSNGYTTPKYIAEYIRTVF